MMIETAYGNKGIAFRNEYCGAAHAMGCNETVAGIRLGYSPNKVQTIKTTN